VGRRLGHPPVLLLDDVLSELDREVGERVLGWLAACGQVLYSATDAEPRAGTAGAVWEVTAGRVEPAGALARGAA
jgi:recombinational DNA repair ATPase RecF